MAGGHDAGRSVEHRAEVVVAAQLSFSGGDTHSDRQSQLPLRGHRGLDGARW